MVTITRKSPFTGKVNEMTFYVRPDVFAAAEEAYYSGELLQNAFPFLDAGEREFYKTGITPQEWTATFGEDE
jgi:hypothetical protein